MSVATKESSQAKTLSAADLMDQLNTETAKLHAWIRTQANAPAQRPWFADTSDASGALAKARVEKNQRKRRAHRWRGQEINPYLQKIGETPPNAEDKPLETTDRQGI